MLISVKGRNQTSVWVMGHLPSYKDILAVQYEALRFPSHSGKVAHIIKEDRYSSSIAIKELANDIIEDIDFYMNNFDTIVFYDFGDFAQVEEFYGILKYYGLNINVVHTRHTKDKYLTVQYHTPIY